MSADNSRLRPADASATSKPTWPPSQHESVTPKYGTAVSALSLAAVRAARIKPAEGIPIVTHGDTDGFLWQPQLSKRINRSVAQDKGLLEPTAPRITAIQHPERSYEYALCKLHVSALPAIAPQEVLLKITRQNAASLKNLYINSPGGAFQQHGPAILYKRKTCEQVYYIVCLNDYDQPALLPISQSFEVKFEGWLNEGLNVAQQLQLLFSKASKDGINVRISLLAGDINQYCRVFLISDRVFVRRSLRSEREATMPAGYK